MGPIVSYLTRYIVLDYFFYKFGEFFSYPPQLLEYLSLVINLFSLTCL